MTGQTISHFRVLDRLGGGGMGVVYVAEDLHLDRRVALKFLPPHLSTDEEAKLRFIQEAKAASALNHPNVCTIYDIDESENGQLFIAMALYEGMTLRQKMEGGALEVEEAADIARQVAEGVAAAHEQGIVHRDIKPANIFISKRGRAVILDFGLAKLTGSLDLTKSGSTLGTAHYMSPEQIRNEEVDGRTDIWSLGVVLYEMLSGKRPFDGDYEQSISYAILNEEAAQPQDVPEELFAVVQQLLSKAPVLRPFEAAEVASRLATFGSGASVQKPAEAAIAALTPARNKMPLMVGGGVLAVALVAFFFFFVSRSSPVDDGVPIVRQGLAVLPFSVRGDAELDYLSEGMVDLLSVVLDGAGDLRTVDPYLVIGEVHRSAVDVSDPVVAAEAVDRLKANGFILGNILKLGDVIRIAASHYRLDGSVISRAEVDIDSLDEIPSAVDGLAQELIALRAEASAEDLLGIAVRTTSSMDALKKYLEGEKLLRSGSYREAEKALGEAVRHDSTFAMALYRRGQAFGWLGRPHDGVIQTLQAANHLEGIPERYRSLIEAATESLKGDLKAAERIYSKLVNEYPNDAHAWTQLGDMLYHEGPVHGRSRVEAQVALERALNLDPTHSETLFHLVELAIEGERYDLADSLRASFEAGDYRERFYLWSTFVRADGDIARDSLVDQISQEDYRTVRFLAHRTRRMSTGLGPYSAGNTELLAGERLYRSLVERSVSEDWHPGWFGWRYAVRHLSRTGRFRDVRSYLSLTHPGWPTAELDKLLHLSVGPLGAVLESELNDIRERIISEHASPEPWDGLYLGQEEVFKAFRLGTVGISLNDWEDVERHAAFLRERAVKDGDGSHAYGFGKTLQAYLAWNAGDAATAKTLLSEIRLPNWALEVDWWEARMHDRQLKATILMAEGKYQEALEIWESLTHTHGVYTTPSYLYRAQCYEGMGDTDRAIGFYRLLVDLWKDADPELQPMVEEARAGLERLLDAEAREPS